MYLFTAFIGLTFNLHLDLLQYEIYRYKNTYIQEKICYKQPDGARIKPGFNIIMTPVMKKTLMFGYAKTKAQIRCAVTAQLISAFVFAT